MTCTILMSQWQTRVRDYEAFSKTTGRSREKPAFDQTPDDPVVNVNWADAKAFCEWLSKKEGRTYRLPTDHEWSCAVGIGDREDPNKSPKEKDGKIADVFPWGSQWPPPNDAGNYCGEELLGLGNVTGFNDGKVFTAPVGSFRPNDLGIYDLGGNVWEWCEDKYAADSAWRVLRGGSWNNNNRENLLSSNRNYNDPDNRNDNIGFRCVVESSPTFATGGDFHHFFEDLGPRKRINTGAGSQECV
jgi:formylglycine-generating enzyme required for sulfatase activity